MTAARRGDLGQRILYRVVRALILTPFKAIFLVRVRGRGEGAAHGRVRGGAVAPVAHGHLLHRVHHTPPHPVHGQAGAVREAVPRLVVHRARRVLGRAGERRPRRVARGPGSARRWRAGCDLPGGDAAARSRHRRPLRRRRLPRDPPRRPDRARRDRRQRADPRVGQDAAPPAPRRDRRRRSDPAARPQRRRASAVRRSRTRRRRSGWSSSPASTRRSRSPACRTTRPQPPQRASSASTSDASIPRSSLNGPPRRRASTGSPPTMRAASPSRAGTSSRSSRGGGKYSSSSVT